MYNVTESQETGKNGPVRRFGGCTPIKSRGAVKNAVQRIYIKYGNTKNLKLYAVGGHHKNGIHIYTQGSILLKIYHVVTI